MDLIRPSPHVSDPFTPWASGLKSQARTRCAPIPPGSLCSPRVERRSSQCHDPVFKAVRCCRSSFVDLSQRSGPDEAGVPERSPCSPSERRLVLQGQRLRVSRWRQRLRRGTRIRRPSETTTDNPYLCELLWIQ